MCYAVRACVRIVYACVRVYVTVVEYFVNYIIWILISPHCCGLYLSQSVSTSHQSHDVLSLGKLMGRYLHTTVLPIK